ncbi:MAG: energy-coupling factor transporter transmembrane protein EcfT [Kiritimatiellae bacterium]|nr:energy-coupling factor transporter transmembrane protein EcfT [Kiritimatiellia bacterium]MDW8459292.1 energy-coupling factor transporter transmembrane component T [Verrucomicrobiota bacterium]
MALLAAIEAPATLNRIDPRARIAVCAAWLFALSAVSDLRALSVACGALAALTLAARLPLRSIAPRFIALNLFLLIWWATIPLLDPSQGWRFAAAIAARANAMLLAITLFISTIEAGALAHALAHLRVPRPLVHVLLLAVRYAEVLWLEQQRMQRAMRARAFRPRPNAHTYRSLTRLVGMLLVRSLDRADRILGAMKCRGYRGDFPLLHHFRFRPLDGVFVAVGLAFAALLVLGGRG